MIPLAPFSKENPKGHFLVWRNDNISKSQSTPVWNLALFTWTLFCLGKGRVLIPVIGIGPLSALFYRYRFMVSVYGIGYLYDTSYIYLRQNKKKYVADVKSVLLGSRWRYTAAVWHISESSSASERKVPNCCHCAKLHFILESNRHIDTDEYWICVGLDKKKKRGGGIEHPPILS